MTETLAQILTYGMPLLIGATIGFVSGLFGLGGGLLAVPILTATYGYTQQLAQGTALLMVSLNTALSIYHYRKKGTLQLKEGLFPALFTLPGGFLGASLALSLPSHELRIGFVCFLIVFVILHYSKRALDKRRGTKPKTKSANRFGMSAVAFLGGCMSGLLGIGGGVLTIPLLTVFFNKDQKQAQGLALLWIFPSALMSFYRYSLGGSMDIQVGLPLAVGGIMTASFGVIVAHKLPERWLTVGFQSLIFVAIGLLLI